MRPSRWTSVNHTRKTLADHRFINDTDGDGLVVAADLNKRNARCWWVLTGIVERCWSLVLLLSKPSDVLSYSEVLIVTTRGFSVDGGS